MSNTASQPDLIISLSHDRVGLILKENIEAGRPGWQASFDVDSIFMEEQIAHSLDRALLENPHLIDEFPCVEIIMLDCPNICVSAQYLKNGILGQIASRHLRLRVGDKLTTDEHENNAVICYTVPSETFLMLKEYYSNIGCSHLASILWNSLSTREPRPEKDSSRLYFTITNDILLILGERNNKLIFSKTFPIKDQADLFYYSIACSRMLKAKEQWLITIGGEEMKYEMPGDVILKIDKQLMLPTLHVLMSQYKVCES